MEKVREGDRLSYYGVLGVSPGCSDDEIRRAYRKLAMRWHPDKWTKSPSLLGQANRKFQQIQEAYSVLSDQRKRVMYDAGLYDPHDDEDEDFSDFLQEMVSLMENERREEKEYSFDEIQTMFWDMFESFNFPQWSDFSQQTENGSHDWHQGLFTVGEPPLKRARPDSTKHIPQEDLHFNFPGFGRYAESCI